MAKNQKAGSTAQADASAAAEEDVRVAASGPAQPAVTRLLVRSRKAGFRRAGRAWPVEETEVAASDLTEVQIAQLLAEPMLAVVVVAE